MSSKTRNKLEMLTPTKACIAFGGKEIIETETNFLIKGCSCCHNSDIFYVLPKEVEVDEKTGKLITEPLFYNQSDKEFNAIFDPKMDFYGVIRFYYGEFNLSKEGMACFTPQYPPKNAKDLLITVCDLDGVVSGRYGDRPDKKLDGVKYFQRTNTHDYWIIPIGFPYALYGDGKQKNKIDWCQFHK